MAQMTGDSCFAELAALFCETLTARYSRDALSPGVTCSWLGAEGKWYISVARYRPYGMKKEKHIITKGTAATPGQAGMLEALQDAVRSWLQMQSSEYPELGVLLETDS